MRHKMSNWKKAQLSILSMYLNPLKWNIFVTWTNCNMQLVLKMCKNISKINEI